METYLVGGAVRDKLLGLPVRERDYVVVGATEDEMRAAGYRSVGRDFPVFLHPETKEEYALARTERKVGPGHQGFECNASPDVTLEEDLARRDLTINAIAEDADGQLVDPYGGQADIADHVLRHVSDAFTEDPLRILRVARFKATLHHLGFHVHESTTRLLTQMVSSGVLAELTPERVLGELNKALITQNPAEFFRYLDTIGANTQLWPELDFSDLAHGHASEPEGRFALMLIGKTPDDIDQLCTRLRCSNERRDISLAINRHHETWQRLGQLSADEIVGFLYELDAIRRDERFRLFNHLCEDIFQAGLEDDWLELLSAATVVKAADIDGKPSGRELGEAIRREQVRRIEKQVAQDG